MTAEEASCIELLAFEQVTATARSELLIFERINSKVNSFGVKLCQQKRIGLCSWTSLLMDYKPIEI